MGKRLGTFFYPRMHMRWAVPITDILHIFEYLNYKHRFASVARVCQQQLAFPVYGRPAAILICSYVVVFLSFIYAMHIAVFATATCLSVRQTPVLCLAERKHDRKMYTI